MSLKQTLVLLFLNILFLFIPDLNGQSVSDSSEYVVDIDHFTTLDGLSNRSVKCMFQDRDDMMWIGTDNGLNRFDGYHFKHWLGKNHGVDLRFIKGITQDADGWLWILTDKTIFLFNSKTEEFQTLAEKFGEDCILLNKTVYRLIADKQGSVFLCTFNKSADRDLDSHYASDKDIYRYSAVEGLKKIKWPIELEHRSLYIADISDSGEFFICYKGSDSQYHNKVFSLANDSLVFLRARNTQTEYPYTTRQIYQTGQAWINDKDNAELNVYNQKKELIISLDNIIHLGNLFFDKKNRAWAGTSFGFHFIELKKNKFSFFENPEYRSGGPIGVRGIFVDSTEMTVAFEYISIRKFNFNSKQWSGIQNNDNIIPMYASNQGLWAGGSRTINLQKDGQLSTFKMITDDTTRLNEQVWSISPSNISSKKLWIGTGKNFFEFDTESKKTQLVENRLIKEKYEIQNIVRDKKNENWLWICSNKGLVLFDEKEEEFLSVYSIDQSKNQFIPTDYVQHLYQDEAGIYWLATADGIIRWDKAKNEYRQLTVADGLPNNVIYAVYPDDYDNLWMSSDYGLIRMNKTTLAIKNYLPEDGLGQTEFNRASHFSYRDKAGIQRLFFGGLNGVTAFYPRDFQADEEEVKPILAILKYEQFNEEEGVVVDNTQSAIANKKIVIEPNDYVHSFEVGLLSYKNVANNVYRYQLKVEGRASDWTTQKSRFIQFGQLPYGKHQLIVTAHTLNNVNAKNDLIIDIIVLRPFYLTWWFVLISIGMIVGGIIYYFNSKNRRLQAKQIELEGLVKDRTEKVEQQAEELKEMDATKSRFFANISHELRTPITLIQGPIQTALNSQELNTRNTTLLTKAKENTQKLVQLVNEILDLIKFDAHKLVLEETTVVFYTFLRSVISNFESIADIQATELVYVYDAPKTLQIKVDKKKLEKVLNNLLTNAFKFTPKNGKIIVHFQDLGNTIQISVKDNGRGIPAEDVPNVFNRYFQSSINKKAEGGLGIGLALSQEFVKLMKGKVWAESQTNGDETGSAFFVQFPKKEVIRMITTEEQLMINDEKQELKEPTKLNEDKPTEVKNETVLIVEDNHDLRDYLSFVLSPHYNIITAENGLDALHQLGITNEELQIAPSELIPHLIISDVMMPIMDGFEFLEKVKSNDKWRGLPFIMLTARAELQTRLSALRIGVDDYLLKPFDEEELLVRVKNLIGNQTERKIFVEEEALHENSDSIETNISAVDQQWLEQTEKLILKEMGNSIFSNDHLADLLSISRDVLYKKIKSLTGLTPTSYTRLIRLQKAKSLLHQGKSVKEVSHEVGFQKPEYFSKLFKKEFGKLPSEYVGNF
ncbi:MAG: signal transduction histidine kinase/DNA-binding response OmpR family regulator [Vicingaceae bacterium]